MTDTTLEEQRIAKINNSSVSILTHLLESVENQTIDEDKFLSETYARLIVAAILGFSPTNLAKDAELAAKNLYEMVEE